MVHIDDSMYIKWSANNEGGIFKITAKGDHLKYEIISGSAIPFDGIIGFLWHWPDLLVVRDLAQTVRRENRWKVISRTGMSGCVDWRIQFMDKHGMIRSTQVLHESMNGKMNEGFDLWIKDLYDMLWYFRKEGLYKSAFDEESVSEISFTDLTEKIKSEKEEFLKDSHESWMGFGSEKYEIDEDLLYK